MAKEAVELDAAVETTPDQIEEGLEEAAATQQAESAGEADTPPWARQLLERQARLEQSNATLQGQVRAYESRLAQQMQHTPPPTSPPEPDPFAGFEPSSEGERLLMVQLQQERARNRAIEAQVAALAREQMSRQQQAALEQANRDLAEIASLAGVDWQEVAAEASAIVPDQDYGRKVMQIIKAKKTAPGGASLSQQRQVAINNARANQQFGEQRRSGGLGGYRTTYDIDGAYAEGELTTAQYIELKKQFRK